MGGRCLFEGSTGFDHGTAADSLETGIDGPTIATRNHATASDIQATAANIRAIGADRTEIALRSGETATHIEEIASDVEEMTAYTGEIDPRSQEIVTDVQATTGPMAGSQAVRQEIDANTATATAITRETPPAVDPALLGPIQVERPLPFAQPPPTRKNKKFAGRKLGNQAANMATISALYEAIKNRECILFLGAGVHYPPPDDSPDYHYPEEQRPPLGTQLSRSLAEESQRQMLASVPAGLPDGEAEPKRPATELETSLEYLGKHRDNLQRTAWFYELHHQREALVTRVSQAVEEGRKPSAVVRALAELDFPIVITTNYDRLFELALGLCSKKVSPIIYEPERHEQSVALRGVPKKGQDERWLFKIHGCVSKPESIVITDEDYIHFVMRMNDGEDFHPIPQKIRTQLAEWPGLFVGYSLLDYNLRLLFRTLRWRIKPSLRPPTFSLDLYPDPLILATYGARENALAQEPLVSFIVQDIWRFVPQLYQQVTGRKMPP